MLKNLGEIKIKLRVKIHRIMNFEFWSGYIFYIPVGFYFLYLFMKYRSFMSFTASNPKIKNSGLIQESKNEILSNFNKKDFIAKYSFILGNLPLEQKVKEAISFINDNNLSYPVILKPDVGQRGSGVKIIQNQSKIRDYISKNNQDLIIQEFITGIEYGVFYVRIPGNSDGKIISITAKIPLKIKANGQDNLKTLILKDKRARFMYKFFFNKYSETLDSIPKKGDLELASIGTHCRGAIFKDANNLITPELEKRIDQISKENDEFYFGRYDLKVPNTEDFKNGKNIKILELNGVGAESTHIYDPKYRLINAYKDLFYQWDLAFRIGKINISRGENSYSFFKLMHDLFSYKEKFVKNESVNL